MSLRNLISSCLLLILSIFSFISVIVYYSLDFFNEGLGIAYPVVYLIIIPISLIIADMKSKKTKEKKRPVYLKILLISIIILLLMFIIYSTLSFVKIGRLNADLPGVALLAIPHYFAILMTNSSIFEVLRSPRMYLGKQRDERRNRYLYFMIFIIFAFGLIYIGLASRIIPEIRLDTSLFFYFSAPVILSLLSMTLATLIFYLKDIYDNNEIEDKAYTN